MEDACMDDDESKRLSLLSHIKYHNNFILLAWRTIPMCVFIGSRTFKQCSWFDSSYSFRVDLINSLTLACSSTDNVSSACEIPSIIPAVPIFAVFPPAVMTSNTS